MSIDAAEETSSVLSHPDLRRYTSARFLAAVATQVQTVAVGWQIFSATGNPLDLGLVGLSQFLPFVTPEAMRMYQDFERALYASL